MTHFITRFASCIFMVCLIFGLTTTGDAEDKKKSDIEKGWKTLFDGKTLDGWKASESPKNWSVEKGCLVGRGKRSHLFYMGDEYTNFEFKTEIYTEPKTNSGIYFHTKYQTGGWPKQGHEAQVNNTHGDPVKTGSLYLVKKNFKSPAVDNRWWTQHIIVNGQRITIKVDGKIIIDYTEPKNVKGNRRLSKGLFALQQHDPSGVVRYRNIRAKKLPNTTK